MDRCDQLEPAPLGEDAGDVENFAAGGLDREISNRARVDAG